MGFFKTLALHRHAEKIASGFSTLRTQQFDSVLRSIETRVEPRAVVRKRLGGDADLALKAYQLQVFTMYSIDHPYVPDEDFREFAGHLNIAVCGTDLQLVEAWLLKFVDFQRQAQREGSEEAYAEQLTRISVPIADYIVPESSPIAWSIVARLMPIFTINTQMVIADEFRDEGTLETLRLQMGRARQALTEKTFEA